VVTGIASFVGGACNAHTTFEVVDASDSSLGADVPVCPAFPCITAGYATLQLACGPSDLTSVTLSGSCATGDSSAASYVGGSEDKFLAIGSTTPGVCNVELVFATGFTFSTDITFASMADPVPPGCGSCPSYVGPTQGLFEVDNPPATCTDAGVAEASGNG